MRKSALLISAKNLKICGDYLDYSPHHYYSCNMKYIWESANWPNFTWNKDEVSQTLLEVTLLKGLLNGRMSGMGFDVFNAGLLDSISSEVVNSAAIENDKLSTDDVRSSIVNHLGMKNIVLMELNSNKSEKAVFKSNERTNSVVEVTIDAVKNCNSPLTIERLKKWQSCFFPDASLYYPPITDGQFRTDRRGPMQVISGPIGREKVHYQAPPAEVLPNMIDSFLNWFNTPASQQGINHIVKSAIAHLYFVSIHPFEDGNGRISRAIADMELSKEDGNGNEINHLFSISLQLCKNRKSYYENLKNVQSQTDLDITSWIVWYLNSLKEAITTVLKELDMVVFRKTFWEKVEPLNLNERQKNILGMLISDSFEGNLTSGKWAKICKCSQDTAGRDINRLLENGILAKSEKSGRSTSYSLVRE